MSNLNFSGISGIHSSLGTSSIAHYRCHERGISIWPLLVLLYEFLLDDLFGSRRAAFDFFLLCSSVDLFGKANILDRRTGVSSHDLVCITERYGGSSATNGFPGDVHPAYRFLILPLGLQMS